MMGRCRGKMYNSLSKSRADRGKETGHDTSCPYGLAHEEQYSALAIARVRMPQRIIRSVAARRGLP